jgi:hypothetical protein
LKNLKHYTKQLLEKGLEEVLCNERLVVSPTATTSIVINNFEKEETNPITTQLVEFE